jgi:Copper type II ascorbate-dependent monooxygenase, C-terminal domain
MKTQSAWMTVRAVVATLSLAGCSATNNGSPAPTASAGDAAAEASANYPGADIGLAPVAPGYVRFETTPLMLAPGDDLLWEEWVAAPFPQDMDIIETTGAQSVGGHHANLYADSNVQPVGTNKKFEQVDQLTQSSLGGIGKELGSAIELPAGVVWRAPMGRSLVIQEHYINAGAAPIMARTALDMKAVPSDPANKVARVLANVNMKVNIPAGQQVTTDTKCVVDKDYPAFMWANHMHDQGTAATTELILADGTTKTLKADPVWDPNWAFSPIYTTFPVESPFVIPAGATLHTTCTWENSSNKTIAFPDEMCIFGAFFIGDQDATCTDGTW